MKYLLIASFALASLTISAQNTIISRPQQKKDQPSKPIKQNPQKKHQQKPTPPKPQSTPTIEEPPKHTLTASFANGELIANGVRYSFVKVEGGTFTMGATSEMLNAQDDEKPTHKVTLTNNYYMGRTEVTQALWKAVMGTNPSHSPGDSKPVENVSWDDCQEFISKLNAATGVTFRLPTEAEWEFAARGGLKTRYCQYSGSNVLSNVAWFADNAEKHTHNVGQKLPNELGFYDMTGNVGEWSNDWYASYFASSQTNPTGPYNGTYHSIRGGSAASKIENCHISIRSLGRPTDKGPGLGLRLVVTAEQSLMANVDLTRSQQISYESFNVNGVVFEMARVEAGSFIIGDISQQNTDDNASANRVTLTNNYYIGKTEVTQALWEAVMGRNPSRHKGNDRPVEHVCWDDCQKFLTKLNAITGMQFRLPTEVEWEFAAKGGINSKHYVYSGSNNLSDVAWSRGNSNGQAHNVGTKLPNELGLYDMSGNVFEWCADCFTYNTINGIVSRRVARGGSYCFPDECCRTSYRMIGIVPDKGTRNPYIGLRLALSE